MPRKRHQVLAYYVDRFENIECGKVGQHFRPHKPAMLLAVLEMMEYGRLRHNRIQYSPELLELFYNFFSAVAIEGDKPTPSLG